jgi:hypothetical protein
LTAARRPSVSRTFLLLLFISLVAFSSGAIYFLHPLTRSDLRTVKERGATIVDALYDLSPNPDFEKTANEYLSDAGM